MNILGLNLYFHDSAAVLLDDGKLVAALEEERWFRDDKHTAIFPKRSIKYCLEALGVDQLNLGHVAINMDPIRSMSDSTGLVDLVLHPQRWNRKHWKNFMDRRKACRHIHWQVHRVLIESNCDQNFQYHLVPHHDSHAASAFFVSPFEEAAVFTIDANGEWPTSSTSIGKGNKLKRLQRVGLPNSLGGFYASVTEFLGFKRNNDEFKVMGLAGYGDPARYRDQMKKLIVGVENGFFRLDLNYFNYADYKISPNNNFYQLFGCPPREPGAQITEQHKAIAASLQNHTEEIVLSIARDLQNRSQLKKLCLAGGVALNCVMNTRILQETDFEEIFIQPASHDSGSALGAAYWVHHQILGNPRGFVLNQVDLGPHFEDAEIESILRAGLLQYRKSPDIAKETAKLLKKGKIVAWFQGRAEFGPRALGFRSILADPTCSHMQDHLNSRVKHREDFRPFAPASTIEDYQRYFDAKAEDFFMTKTCQVKEEYQNRLPAITHIDGSARLQTVKKEVNPLFHRLIREFEHLSGFPIIINTSFNINGEPMVLSPRDALRCFFTTGIDALAIGNFILAKGG